MGLTSIADQKTPGRPVELTFAADTSLPSANQEVLLIGHSASGTSSGTATVYEVVDITNASDVTAATTEAETKFGVGSELAAMVVAAVKANALNGSSNFPALKCIKLAYADTGFGSSDIALTNASKVKAEFLVSCYDADDDTLRGKLKDTAVLMSGAQRVENNQFGTFGVSCNQDVSDPSTLPSPDTSALICIYKRDSAPTRTVGEEAAAAAAVMAANAVPFNPLDDVVIGGASAPAADSDKITVGAGLESETVLNKGWTPIKTKPNGDQAFVRTVTSRITTDGSTAATSYYDVQDFQVLFYWRKTLFTRFSQPDLKQTKASAAVAQDVRSEMIRMAKAFEAETMFQAVDKLAKYFQVARSSSDRHRFDCKTPVNVVPGLHVIASNVQATTEFDTFSI